MAKFSVFRCFKKRDDVSGGCFAQQRILFGAGEIECRRCGIEILVEGAERTVDDVGPFFGKPVEGAFPKLSVVAHIHGQHRQPTVGHRFPDNRRTAEAVGHGMAHVAVRVLKIQQRERRADTVERKGVPVSGLHVEIADLSEGGDADRKQQYGSQKSKHVNTVFLRFPQR